MTKIEITFIFPTAFQLTSSRRGWPNRSNGVNHCVNFNSHPHEEDDYTRCVTTPGLHISTHILTKRMTVDYYTDLYRLGFQLTSSRRGWQHLTRKNSIWRIFQLTSSRRGWPFAVIIVLVIIIYFNSHPHEEDDYLTTGLSVSVKLYFNSHPHEEDDRGYWRSSDFRSISTHILTKRMTAETETYNEQNNISTHILTKRMTANSEDIASLKTFQLTSSRRGWQLLFMCP